MPSTQVELDYRNKSLNRILDIWHGKEGFWVCHEARIQGRQLGRREIRIDYSYLVILSSMDLGSRMNVGSTTLLKSAPGRS